MPHQIQQPREHGGTDIRVDASDHDCQPESKSAWLRERGRNLISDRHRWIVVAIPAGYYWSGDTGRGVA